LYTFISPPQFWEHMIHSFKKIVTFFGNVWNNIVFCTVLNCVVSWGYKILGYSLCSHYFLREEECLIQEQSGFPCFEIWLVSSFKLGFNIPRVSWPKCVPPVCEQLPESHTKWIWIRTDCHVTSSMNCRMTEILEG
jgi:hypothetical protein